MSRYSKFESQPNAPSITADYDAAYEARRSAAQQYVQTHSPEQLDAFRAANVQMEQVEGTLAQTIPTISF